MKFFRKKEPRIILYMLYKDPEYKELVYICTNKDEIEEFTTKKILLDNYLHYSSWCKLRNYKEDDKQAQNEYVENLLLESEKAREEINREKEQALKDLRAEVADLAVDAAGKIIGRSVTVADHENLVNEFIKEVGDAK